MMSTFSFALLITLISCNANCDYGDSRQIVAEAEMLIEHRAPMEIPRGPVGTWPVAGCTFLGFRIDLDGNAESIKINHSSGSRIVDLAAIKALKSYKFNVPNNINKDFILVFRWQGHDTRGSEDN